MQVNSQYGIIVVKPMWLILLNRQKNPYCICEHLTRHYYNELLILRTVLLHFSILIIYILIKGIIIRLSLFEEVGDITIIIAWQIKQVIPENGITLFNRTSHSTHTRKSEWFSVAFITNLNILQIATTRPLRCKNVLRLRSLLCSTHAVAVK